MKTFFITGTDTGIGKTHVTVGLLNRFNEKGYSTFGMKPIASGCHWSAEGQRMNEDALALQAVSSIKRPYQQVNPIALAEPIAPHLAAEKAGINLSKNGLVEVISNSLVPSADVNVIEGVGGWSVPLNNHELFSEVIAHLKIPTLLVIGIKLGCINHALLTCQSIVQMRVPFLGWIANCIEPDVQFAKENIKALSSWIPAPCLGSFHYGLNPSDPGNQVNIPLINKP